MVTNRAADAAPAPCRAAPLEILLTNDDGYRSPGIEALHKVLRDAGHHVTRVAPADNASGSSLSFSWEPLRIIVDPRNPRVVGVIGATPANAVVFAATTMFRAAPGPDLVISGINDGPNAGALVSMSGTVGAAMAATLMLDPPVPAIALSAARIGAKGGIEQTQQFADVARDFAGRLPNLLGALCAGPATGQFDTVFNINYPARKTAAIEGIAVAPLDDFRSIRVRYDAAADGVHAPHIQRLEPSMKDAGTDVTLLERGYVTVTPLRARPAAAAMADQDLQERLGEGERLRDPTRP